MYIGSVCALLGLDFSEVQMGFVISFNTQGISIFLQHRGPYFAYFEFKRLIVVCHFYTLTLDACVCQDILAH